VIQKIEDIEMLNSFNKLNKITTFLQTKTYFEFLKSKNIKVEVQGEIRNNTLISSCLFSIVEAKRGKALQIIHGPVVPDGNVMTFRQYLDCLKNIAKQNKCDFIRLNPINEFDEKIDTIFKTNGFLLTPFENVFHRTNRIDLTKLNKNNLNKNFSLILQEKIKDYKELENKKQLRIDIVKELDDDCRFLTEQQETEQQTFDSIKDITNFLGQNNMSIVAKCYYNDKLVAFQTFVTNYSYICNHHGASLKDNIDFTSFIHYKMILHALENNFELYDFWGVSEINDSKHPWNNSSKIKRHFGGYDVENLSGYDFPLTPKYWVMNLYEKYQKIKRGH
jgi:lipid II:glycine glycyltransferase (peptidoglycan interpeptide bridge formation enzyme)